MTIRLLALMSVVLLLSLAALGLMMNHYQDQVMQEVARTASEVGRATLRTLDLQADPTLPAAPAKRVMAWHEVPRGVGSDPGPEPGAAERDVWVHEVEREGTLVAGSVVQIVASELGPEADLEELPADVVHSLTVVCETDEGGEETCVSSADDTGVAGLHGRFFIKIDDVHAESDPKQGLVLKIPRFTPEALAKSADLAAAAAETHPSPTPGRTAWTRHEEIRLPIPVGDYETLFDSLRKRSLWMFLGVFMVGTALSAGLASRFTRPARRLDAAIRRLSNGDLDVRVETRGKDEIARLGRAFNEMTRSLRASRQRAREMVRREKHSALGRLAAGVAHDIRNPLHSIGLTLQHLRETCRPEDAERGADFDRALEIIRGEIRRLDNLVGNFLRFARSERHERHPVDLRELLQETARLVSKEAEWRRVEIDLELPEEVPRVRADGEAVRSSILNLVLNSFEAMPQGGELTLALRVDGDDAVVEVSDTGEGIAESDQDRVFDFAFTTREGGNGLGLAMVYQCVVEDHGGQVALDSRPAGGTRVSLKLPLRAGTQEGRA